MSLTIRKFRHCCLLLDFDGGPSAARILLDPGSFSAGFEALRDLTGIVITHSHVDHLDVDRIAELASANPDATVLADSSSAQQLSEKGVAARTVQPGEQLQLGGVQVDVYVGEHASIAPGVDVPPNVGYLLRGDGVSFGFGGDSVQPPPEPVDVLGLPTAAPWLKAAEAVEMLQQARPRFAVPVHEALLATTTAYYRLYERFAGEQQTEWRVLDDGAALQVG